MVERLRDDLDALEVAVAVVAEATRIPASNVEKDFWLTEALRGGVHGARGDASR